MEPESRTITIADELDCVSYVGKDTNVLEYYAGKLLCCVIQGGNTGREQTPDSFHQCPHNVVIVCRSASNLKTQGISARDADSRLKLPEHPLFGDLQVVRGVHIESSGCAS